QSIPCSPECKIVRKILLDHPLSYALTATADVPVVDTLHLLVETLKNPFVSPVNIQTIEAFMNRVGYQGVVDKVSAFYTKNLAQPWQTIRRKSSSIDEYYHSIKDDIPLVSVYTTGNVLVRGMLILDEFLIEKICATNDYKEYETVFVDEGEKDKQSYDDADDSDDRLEPRSHKENPEHVDDDDDEEKVDEKKDDEMGSLETRTEEM
ncbi:hypothetical protein Tco_0048353, partial [Tanacetum coccineum]